VVALIDWVKMTGLALDKGWALLKRSALTGLPRALVLAAAGLLTLSILGTLLALGIFFWYDTVFWYYFEVGPVLKVAALILCRIHCKLIAVRQIGYGSGVD
jgi:hypothetical protein